MKVRRGGAARDVWRRLVAEQKSSQLSIEAFCTRQKVSTSSFYRWKQVLKSEPASARASQAPPPRFLPISLSGGSGLIEIQLPSGVILRVPPGADEQSLSVVLRALEARPC
jgi:hypothetical protein